MIKLIAIEKKECTQLLLCFSDGAWGTHEFSRFNEAHTEMTPSPLRDPDFFGRLGS